jgi:hypothetical protein
MTLGFSLEINEGQSGKYIFMGEGEGKECTLSKVNSTEVKCALSRIYSIQVKCAGIKMQNID